SFCATRRDLAGSAGVYHAAFCFTDLRAQARRCLRELRRKKQGSRFWPHRVPASRKNSPDSARLAYAISSRREENFRRASSSSTRSTPWDVSVGAVATLPLLIRIRR